MLLLFSLLQLTISSSLLSEELVKVVFLQKRLFPVVFKLLDVSLLPFSISKQVDIIPLKSLTDSLNWSLPDTPEWTVFHGHSYLLTWITISKKIPE